MKAETSNIRLSATDLSNHLSCQHLTSLELNVVNGLCLAPEWRFPDLAVIRELGLRHEAAYLRFLQDKGVGVADLRAINDDQEGLLETRSHMELGTEAIAQGRLSAGRWFGQPDLLRKVPKPSRWGPWSYEVHDCKLARETKAATILQISLYSALLADIQGDEPEFMHVVPAGRSFTPESHRFAEYAAYFRHVKRRLEEFCDDQQKRTTYPEPCAHCDVCRWFRECDERRRTDDHLSLVAGITRLQRNQFVNWQADTTAKLAGLPIPLTQKPSHGSKEAHTRAREQARVQIQGRTQKSFVHELLPVESQTGFCTLPEPSPFDVFLDLETDPFAEGGGRHYLFGYTASNEQTKSFYERRWSFTPREERDAFEWMVDEIMRRWSVAPSMHVYHFGGHETGALKALMGRHVTREDEVDRMLRAHLFVDLHTILKQAVRASVEEYSLKAMEPFHTFVRKMSLADSREAMTYVEHWLELGWQEELPVSVREIIEAYNEDDCRSAASLRDWLERGRSESERGGTVIPRPAIGEGAPSEELGERQKRVAALADQLVEGIVQDPANRPPDQSARWMLAQLLDWHRREAKAGWWEGYRLAGLDDEQLMDERVGLAGLEFSQRVRVERQIPVDRYLFPRQETELREGEELYHRGERIGSVAAIDPVERTLDIKKTRKAADLSPASVYMWDRPISTTKHADSLLRVGEWVRDNGIDAPGPYRAARDLLLRRAPRLKPGEQLSSLPGEQPVEAACRVVNALKDGVFAIQGPPGAGKTYTGARMICHLVNKGKKIGITALSHKVIAKLLDEVVDAARYEDVPRLRCMQRWNAGEGTEDVRIARDDDAPLQALRSGAATVVGGTSWLWTMPEYFEAVDALFIDEAGQMSLADVIAVSQAAKDVVLIGDPQQLERPLQGSHPIGAEKSALQHLLGDHKTIPETMGLLLPETWRMHPEICKFTSELFYDGRLGARELTRDRILAGHPSVTGAGLWFVPVVHEGNRNSSPQEVAVIRGLLDSLLQPRVTWTRSAGNTGPLKLQNILIVAPYNAQVADLLARLPTGASVGTVDKFQGQEAPVVIYSLATSSPADAPRGMEFLFSLNRFNVATSRGMSAVIVVGCPRLFEPECRTPRQMQLANAFCRFAEMARVIGS